MDTKPLRVYVILSLRAVYEARKEDLKRQGYEVLRIDLAEARPNRRDDVLHLTIWHQDFPELKVGEPPPVRNLNYTRKPDGTIVFQLEPHKP